MTITPDVTFELSDAAWGQLEEYAITRAELWRLLDDPAMTVPTGVGSEVRVNGHGLTAVLDGRRVLAVGIDGATADNRGEWAVERAFFGDGADAEDAFRRSLRPRPARVGGPDEDTLAARARARQERELQALIARTLKGAPAPVAPPVVPAEPVVRIPAPAPVPEVEAVEADVDEDELFAKIHPRLWRQVTRLADGDLSRIVVHSPTSVEILPPS